MAPEELTRAEIVELGEPRTGPCVSIFMPVRGIAAGVREDQLRLSHLGKRAVDLLGRLHLREEDSLSLVEPQIQAARDLASMWSRRDSSISLFISPGKSYIFNVPLWIAEQVVAAPGFITRPLAPLIELNSPHYLLALGRDNTRVYRVTSARLVPFKIADMPSGVEAVSQFENTLYPEHYRAPGSGGRFFHGHGGNLDTKTQLEMEFLRLVSAAVTGYVTEKRGLLMLAGEARLLSQFRKISDHLDIADGEIRGSAARVREADLFTEAWKIVLAEAALRRKTLADTVIEMWNGPRVTWTVQNVLPAAVNGRVLELFVATDAEQWGRADEAGNIIEERGHIGLGTTDLLDLCAHFTLKGGGSVHAVSLAEMPGGPSAGAAVALLRS